MQQWWQRLVDWLAITAAERRVILFLAIALLLGLGIRLIKSEVQEPPEFDYQRSDSTFAALSEALRNDTLSVPESRQGLKGNLNMNTATDVQLETLPGIGTVIAERIIRYRETNGPFTSADELLNIKGMTKKRLEQIKDFITIDRP